MPLPELLDQALHDAVAAYRARVEADERAAEDAVGWWNDLTGGGSARAGRSSARAGRTLFNTYEANAERARATGDAALAVKTVRGIADALRMPALAESLAFLTFTGGATSIAKDTARDVADVAVTTGKGWRALLVASPLVFVLLAALFVFTFARSWSPALRESP